MTQTLSAEQRKANMIRIYHDWDEALSENDAEARLKLYAKDAAIESPSYPTCLAKRKASAAVTSRCAPSSKW